MNTGPRIHRDVSGAKVASCEINHVKHKVSDPSAFRNINDLWVPEQSRGKGYAATLLDQVCGEADRVGMHLLVEPNPYASGGKDRIELVGFYMSRGFEQLPDTPWMVRQCKGKRNATS